MDALLAAVSDACSGVTLTTGIADRVTAVVFEGLGFAATRSNLHMARRVGDHPKVTTDVTFASEAIEHAVSLSERRSDMWAPESVSAPSAFQWRVCQPGSELVVALGGPACSEPIGYALGEMEAGVGVIDEVAVLPERRRHGLGTALMAEVARRLEARGASTLRLVVVADNPARVVYERLGYAATSEVVVYERPDASPR